MPHAELVRLDCRRPHSLTAAKVDLLGTIRYTEVNSWERPFPTLPPSV